MKTLLVTVVLTGALLVAGVAGPAWARAEVSAECWSHLGGVKTANTPAADRRYHLERGQHSPCTEYDAAESSGSRQQEPAAKDNSDDRFCIGRCNDKWWRDD